MQLISCSVKGGAWKCCKKLKVQRLGKYCRQDSINALNFSRGQWRILKNYQDKGWHFCMHILPDDAHIGGLEYGATSGKQQNFHWFMLLDFFYWLFNMFLLIISSFVLINWCESFLMEQFLNEGFRQKYYKSRHPDRQCSHCWPGDETEQYFLKCENL